MISITRNLCNVCKESSKRFIATSPSLHAFWDRDEKSGYRDNRKYPPFKERMRDGLKILKSEIALWKEEMKERFEFDPILIFRAGEVDVVWRFGNEESLAKWINTDDRDNNEGYSKSSFTLTKEGKALFSGVTDMRVPKDGKAKRAGYCNIKTIRAKRSFQRDSYLNWTSYNMLVMRIRGDGRTYLLNLHTKGYHDLAWNDMYHFPLFTRGGPYWQLVRIPFSKFFYAAKGRIQDRQESIPLDRIASFGITAAERYGGEFSLEIDYIGVEFDPNHTEEFAYEMYKTDKYIVRC
ncbi:complex I intermediate-associated protein 30 [Leptinotarsa decemlineata]|uniref:complex I intermediate-associated protein 30 n=1 Tax=Leptinotarsa decemlineata TaxID=7539 RepID=UPI003D306F1A